MPLGEVLVVDDEPKLLNLVREVLSSTGYSVRTAESGDEVFEAVAESLPDLVLLDVVLRGAMDGYQVARRLREFSQVPIILVTARGREQDVLAGFAAGADDYLCKPFSSRELLVRVRAVLRRSAQHGNGKAESILELRRDPHRPGAPHGERARPGGAPDPDRVPAAPGTGTPRR